MTQVNEISILTSIHNLFFFFCGLITSGNESGEINYCIGSRIGKVDILFLVLLVLPLLTNTLLMKPPCNITII